MGHCQERAWSGRLTLCPTGNPIIVDRAIITLIITTIIMIIIEMDRLGVSSDAQQTCRHFNATLELCASLRATFKRTRLMASGFANTASAWTSWWNSFTSYVRATDGLDEIRMVAMGSIAASSVSTGLCCSKQKQRADQRPLLVLVALVCVRSQSNRVDMDKAITISRQF